MWLNEFNISKCAYYYCRDVEDLPGVRKHITSSLRAYLYCFNIYNDPEVRKYITEELWLKDFRKD